MPHTACAHYNCLFNTDTAGISQIGQQKGSVLISFSALLGNCLCPYLFMWNRTAALQASFHGIVLGEAIAIRPNKTSGKFRVFVDSGKMRFTSTLRQCTCVCEGLSRLVPHDDQLVLYGMVFNVLICWHFTLYLQYVSVCLARMLRLNREKWDTLNNSTFSNSQITSQIQLPVLLHLIATFIWKTATSNWVWLNVDETT